MGNLRTLPEALEQAARSEHGYTFVGSGGPVHRPYSAMYAAARSVAGGLAEAGLRPGDLVAIVLTDSEEFLTTLFGASMAGVIPASLYPPQSTTDHEAYFALTAGALRSAGARVVVTSPSLIDGFERVRAACPSLRLVLSRENLATVPAGRSVAPALDDIAFVQFTSGSTSSPKGVALSHRNLCANVDAINGPNGMATTDADSGVSWLPLYHDMGLIGMALGPLYSARPGIFLTTEAFVKRPIEWLRAISTCRATVSFAPNFAYDLCTRRVKDRDLASLDLSCWRIAGCGAEPIHAPTLAAFAERFAPAGFSATSFLPSYGLAEHVLAATFPSRGRHVRVERVSSTALSERRIAIAAADTEQPTCQLVSCGMALPGHRLRIVDGSGRELGERQVGEITLAGPSVMLGYYGDDELTRETIRDGWLHTGDLGYLSDGELFVCGRVKDLIIVNGRKYHPQDLEWGVDGVAGVRRGRVVAFGTGTQGERERVVMVVEPNGTVEAAALVDNVRRRIAELHGVYVDEVAVVPSGAVARTTSGKVQRAATRARYERGELAMAGERGADA